MLTPEGVQRRLDKIKRAVHATNFETAHALEDRMFFAVLRAIATGTCKDPKECAKIAIQVLDYPRWFS